MPQGSVAPLGVSVSNKTIFQSVAKFAFLTVTASFVPAADAVTATPANATTATSESKIASNFFFMFFLLEKFYLNPFGGY